VFSRTVGRVYLVVSDDRERAAAADRGPQLAESVGSSPPELSSRSRSRQGFS